MALTDSYLPITYTTTYNGKRRRSVFAPSPVSNPEESLEAALGAEGDYEAEAGELGAGQEAGGAPSPFTPVYSGPEESPEAALGSEPRTGQEPSRSASVFAPRREGTNPLDELQAYVAGAPKLQPPSRGRRILGAILGGIEGFTTDNAAAGAATGREAAYGPQLLAREQYQQGLTSRELAAQAYLQALENQRRQAEAEANLGFRSAEVEANKARTEAERARQQYYTDRAAKVGPSKPSDESGKLLTPSEAALLKVPYGTTRAQASGKIPERPQNFVAVPGGTSYVYDPRNPSQPARKIGGLEEPEPQITASDLRRAGLKLAAKYADVADENGNPSLPLSDEKDYQAKIAKYNAFVDEREELARQLAARRPSLLQNKSQGTSKSATPRVVIKPDGSVVVE